MRGSARTILDGELFCDVPSVFLVAYYSAAVSAMWPVTSLISIISTRYNYHTYLLASSVTMIKNIGLFMPRHKRVGKSLI